MDQPEEPRLSKQENNIFVNNSVASFDNVTFEHKGKADIFTLNDDCLEHIFKFLTLHDQVNFALSCQRFACILDLLATVQLKSFDMYVVEELTTFQVCQYLKIVGPKIKTLKADVRYFDSETELFPLFGTFCLNVEKLKVYANSTKTLCKLVKNMYLLQEIELVRVCFDDEFIKYLQKFKNLKALNIISNYYISGSEIYKLTDLEKLTLYRCPKIIPQVEDICKNLTNLNYLDIRCDSFDKCLDSKDYEHIAKYLLKLKTLKLICKKGNVNCIATLPNLTNLVIKFIDSEKTEGFLKHLAKHQANQLEELGVYTKYFSLKASTSVAKLKKLKVLKCQFSFDDEVMKKFLKLKALEKIEFYEESELSSDGVLELLENCLKLKHIGFWCTLDDVDEVKSIISKLYKFLQKQRDQGRRKDVVNFVFKGPSNPITLRKYKFPDILQITEAASICKGIDT